ncbi:MAG: 30S ribosomal protein S6 [Defluviitaleaceae bacterium]|nr:30S ribosomal protein S6 [Defluviitaleaceae bacterium]
MNKYELGVIVRADLEEEVFRAEMERVKGFIDRFGGTIDKIDDWGRRKLAYPISKLNEGMYTFITYSSEGNTPKEVEARLRLQENVLRFLTIRRDETEIAAPAPKAAEPAEAPEPVESVEVEEAPAPAEEPSAEAAE